jgi:hypothetical protein
MAFFSCRGPDMSPRPFLERLKAQFDTRFSYGNVFTESRKKFHNLGALSFPYILGKKFPVIGKIVNALKTLWKQSFLALSVFVGFFGIFFAFPVRNLSRTLTVSTVSLADSFGCNDKN